MKDDEEENNKMPDVKEPLVSCLCVTEGRPAFMPWVLWCFDRQSWSQRELVIVDSSPQPLKISGRDDIRVVTAPSGTSVPRKRNLAIQQAQGEIITWFDDDDWQHPNKLSLLVEALSNGASYAGSPYSWFVDLMKLRCTPCRASKQIIFNSAGFIRESVLPLSFRENLSQASDTLWMHELAKRYRGRSLILNRDVMFFWLCHEKNLSNPSKRRHFNDSLEVLKKQIGAEAWGDTDEALKELQIQLQGETRYRTAEMNTKSRKAISAPSLAKSQPLSDQKRKEGGSLVEEDPPPAGVMIKATVMDAPFLDVMVRHMISQARYPFTERTIVVDRQSVFTGKYRTRPRSSQKELDQILERLLEDGTISHVREVDMKSTVVREILERYFIKDAPRVSIHAATGGPIYATLFGLESMSTDHVLQMDADIFFYTGQVSWVSQALKSMARDPRLWLMMSHPGPPAGPQGKSLGRRNVRYATWDDELRIWRFGHATTRYFLCDRRKLHYKLQLVPMVGGCAPLELCISDALQRHGAFRGNLGNLESWHIHAWYHGDPFPLWAFSLAKAIEAGYFPAFQRGDYDLRLDRSRDRREWGELLERVTGNAPISAELAPNVCATDMPTSSQQKKACLSFSSSKRCINTRQNKIEVSDAMPVSSSQENSAKIDLAGAVPLAVVIPVRNRAGQRMRNTLYSLNWQSAGRPAQILVVSHGSQTNINRELSKICDEEKATLITVGDPTQPWNKPFALNTGIRATQPELDFVMTMDSDMILAPNFLTVIIERLKSEPPALVLCQISDLPQHAPLPTDREKLMDTFNSLHAITQPRNRSGSGGIQAARRSFFFEIRGYDEDLVWWGAMDNDIIIRARLAGLAIEWIDNRTAMLHQWHPRKYNVLTCPREIEQARQAWWHNHELIRSRSTIIRRNPNGWGGVAP